MLQKFYFKTIFNEGVKMSLEITRREMILEFLVPTIVGVLAGPELVMAQGKGEAGGKLGPEFEDPEVQSFSELATLIVKELFPLINTLECDRQGTCVLDPNSLPEAVKTGLSEITQEGDLIKFLVFQGDKSAFYDREVQVRVSVDTEEYNLERFVLSIGVMGDGSVGITVIRECFSPNIHGQQYDQFVLIYDNLFQVGEEVYEMIHPGTPTLVKIDTRGYLLCTERARIMDLAIAGGLYRYFKSQRLTSDGELMNQAMIEAFSNQDN